MKKFFQQTDKKKLFSIIGFLIIAAGIVLTVYLSQQRQDVRQRAAGEQTELYFAKSGTTTKLSTITIQPGIGERLDLFLDTKSNPVNSFDIGIAFSNETNGVYLSFLTDGADANRFGTQVFRNSTTGSIRFTKIHADTSVPPPSGKLHLLTLLIAPRPSASVNTTSTIGFTGASITSPSSQSLLTYERGDITVTLANPTATPTLTPIPTTPAATSTSVPPTNTPVPVPGVPTVISATPGCNGKPGTAYIVLRWSGPGEADSYDVADTDGTVIKTTTSGEYIELNPKYHGASIIFKVRSSRSGVKSAYVNFTPINQEDCTLAPTATPTLTPAPTTPAATATPTQTPTPTTPAATATLAPTVTPLPGTRFSFSLKLNGIGDGVLENDRPIHQQRSFRLEIFNASELRVAEKVFENEFLYNAPGSKRFEATGVSLNQMLPPAGSYIFKISTAGYLRKRIPGIHTIAADGRVAETLNTTLVVGDINNDNKLDIADYSLYRACYGKNATDTISIDGQPFSCVKVDLNDDGRIDSRSSEKDYRLLVDSFGTQVGD